MVDRRVWMSDSQTVVENEKLLPGVFHDMSAKVINEIRNCKRCTILVRPGYSKGVATFV